MKTAIMVMNAFYIEIENNWQIETNELEALSMGSNTRFATIAELREETNIDFGKKEYLDYVVQVDEGFFVYNGTEWHEIDLENEDYIFVT